MIKPGHLSHSDSRVDLSRTSLVRIRNIRVTENIRGRRNILQ